MPTTSSTTTQRQQKHIVWHNEQATAVFAQNLAELISSDSSYHNLIIKLWGDLGAGKTTFTRYLLTALGVSGKIKSPTYAIVEPYQLQQPELAIWHFDCYRLNDPQEWEDAGFNDILTEHGLKIIEWPQKAAPLLPAADLDIEFTVNQQTRHVSIGANNTTGNKLLSLIAYD